MARQTYKVYDGARGLGRSVKSLTEAVDLARHILKEGRAVTIEPEEVARG